MYQDRGLVELRRVASDFRCGRALAAVQKRHRGGRGAPALADHERAVEEGLGPGALARRADDPDRRRFERGPLLRARYFVGEPLPIELTDGCDWGWSDAPPRATAQQGKRSRNLAAIARAAVPDRGGLNPAARVVARHVDVNIARRHVDQARGAVLARPSPHPRPAAAKRRRRRRTAQSPYTGRSRTGASSCPGSAARAATRRRAASTAATRRLATRDDNCDAGASAGASGRCRRSPPPAPAGTATRPFGAALPRAPAGTAMRRRRARSRSRATCPALLPARAAASPPGPRAAGVWESS